MVVYLRMDLRIIYVGEDARGEVWVRTKAGRLGKTCIQKDQLDGPQRLGVVVCDEG